MSNIIIEIADKIYGALTVPVRVTMNALREFPWAELPGLIINGVLNSSPIQIVGTTLALVLFTCKGFDLDNEVCKASNYIVDKGLGLLSDFTSFGNDEQTLYLRGSIDNSTQSAEIE